MTPLTLAPPCNDCTGACCRQRPGYSFAVLLTNEEASNYSEAQDSLYGKVIPYADGQCQHLKDNRCQIYATRPTACREFDCVQGYNLRGPGWHSFFLEDCPEVVVLIERRQLSAGLRPCGQKKETHEAQDRD